MGQIGTDYTEFDFLSNDWMEYDITDDFDFSHSREGSGEVEDSEPPYQDVSMTMGNVSRNRIIQDAFERRRTFEHIVSPLASPITKYMLPNHPNGLVRLKNSFLISRGNLPSGNTSAVSTGSICDRITQERHPMLSALLKM